MECLYRSLRPLQKMWHEHDQRRWNLRFCFPSLKMQSEEVIAFPQFNVLWLLVQNQFLSLEWDRVILPLNTNCLFCRWTLARALRWFVSLQPGRNEVYFFIADPVFWPKFLIPDAKSDDNFDPWSHKISLIPRDFLFIAPMRHHYYIPKLVRAL